MLVSNNQLLCQTSLRCLSCSLLPSVFSLVVVNHGDVVQGLDHLGVVGALVHSSQSFLMLTIAGMDQGVVEM